MLTEPHRILERLLNSYKLETLNGQPVDGEFHTRRLRKFIPREGTELAIQQKEVEERKVDLEELGEESEDPANKGNEDLEGNSENNEELQGDNSV